MPKFKCPGCGNQDTFWVDYFEKVSYRGHLSEESDSNTIELSNPKTVNLEMAMQSISCDNCDYTWDPDGEDTPEVEWV